MDQVFKVWKVIYKYDAPSSRSSSEPITEEYLLIASAMGKAEKIADNLFVPDDDDGYKQNLLRQGEVQKAIKEDKRRVPFPKLTLDEDRKNFSLEARVCGETIEYIVRTKS